MKHHSVGIITSIPLVKKFEHTLIFMCMRVFVCDGVGDQLVVFSLWVPVSAQSSRVVPMIPSLLDLEVQHFWHPLTLLHYNSQLLWSQKAHSADYYQSYSLLVESDSLYSRSSLEMKKKHVVEIFFLRFFFLRLRSIKTRPQPVINQMINKKKDQTTIFHN